MSASSLNGPEAITGGCLCKSIQFTISFSKNQKWPPESATCQCTMCRKWTSSLVAQFLVIEPSQITPNLSTFSAYKEYTSSPQRYRGFCSECGTSLIWRSDDKTDLLDLYLGTVDEKWLIGEIVKGSEKKTKYGTEVKREGGYGKELCTPSQFQFYYENAIQGVTDILDGGKKYLTENVDAEPLN